jgi:hypothetical protein
VESLGTMRVMASESEDLIKCISLEGEVSFLVFKDSEDFQLFKSLKIVLKFVAKVVLSNVEVKGMLESFFRIFVVPIEGKLFRY